MTIFVPNQNYVESDNEILFKEFANVFKPITFIFKLLGFNNIRFDLATNSTNSQTLKLSGIPIAILTPIIRIFLVILMILNVLQTINSLQNLLFICGISKCSLKAGIMITVFISYLTYFYVQVQGHEISIVMSKLIRLTAHNFIVHSKHRQDIPNYIRKLRRQIGFLLTSFLLYTICGPAICIILTIWTWGVQNYYDSSFYNGPIYLLVVSFLDDYYFAVINAVINLCNISILTPFLLVCGKLLYIFVILVKINFDVISKENHRRMSALQMALKTKSFLKDHRATCDMLFEVNRVMSFMICIWISLLFILIICFFRAITLMNNSRLASVAFFTIFIAITFTFVVLFMDSVNSQVS